MQLFYLPDLSSDSFIFSEEESRHCVKVLRKKAGDLITLIDGKGTEATGQIESDHPKKCSGTIISRFNHPKNRAYTLHLAIAPTKQSERLDWLIEKVTEIGVDKIHFVETMHTERSRLNPDRITKITVSAIKQSKQYYLPEILPIQSFNSFVNESGLAIENRFIAWCPEPQGHSLTSKLLNKTEGEFLVMIGPEGDFDPSEIKAAIHNGFIPVSLGPNILRAETASVFVASTFSTLLSR